MNTNLLIRELESLKFPTKKTAGTEVAYNEALKASVLLIKKHNELQQNIIPKYVSDLVEWTVNNNTVPSDVIEEFIVRNDIIPIDKINLPEGLELEKLSDYFQIACHRYDFERACFCGYSLEKKHIAE